MKKLIFPTLLMSLAFIQPATAKESTSLFSVKETTALGFNRPVIGARYMPTVTSLKVQTYNGTVSGDFVLGHGFGGILGFNFSNHFGLQGEFIYNKLSQKHQDDQLVRKIDLDYINIPLLVSLNTNRSAPVNLNFVFGPQIGINAGASLTTSGTANGNTNVEAVLAVKKNDFGFAYGAGLDIGLGPLKSFRIDFGFRGVFGLIDISDDSKTLETDQYYILEKTSIKTYSVYAGITLLI